MKSTKYRCWHQHYIFLKPNHSLIMDLVVSTRKCVRAFYKLLSTWQLPFCSVVVSTVAGILTEDLPVWTFSALLELVTDWSLVLDERSLRTEDGILIFFLLHLYSVDICNGWKINVSDVPVNVNKNKAHFEGYVASREYIWEWWQHGEMMLLVYFMQGELQGLMCRCFVACYFLVTHQWNTENR